MDEVAEDLVIVWKQYARAPDAELSPKALELKRRLLEAVEELPVRAKRLVSCRVQYFGPLTRLGGLPKVASVLR